MARKKRAAVDPTEWTLERLRRWSAFLEQPGAREALQPPADPAETVHANATDDLVDAFPIWPADLDALERGLQTAVAASPFATRDQRKAFVQAAKDDLGSFKEVANQCGVDYRNGLLRWVRSGGQSETAKKIEKFLWRYLFDVESRLSG
jgi:hypothetical protein